MKLSRLADVFRPTPYRVTSEELTPYELAPVVTRILKSVGNRYREPLESYLRSLWGLVLAHEKSTVSYSLLGRLIQQAFESRPVHSS